MQYTLCDIPSGRCSFKGPWTVTRSSLRMLRRVAAFCRPLRPVLLLVSFPRSRSPVVGVPGLRWMWRDLPFARQRRPVAGVLGLCWLLWGSFDCFCCPHTSALPTPNSDRPIIVGCCSSVSSALLERLGTCVGLGEAKTPEHSLEALLLEDPGRHQIHDPRVPHNRQRRPAKRDADAKKPGPVPRLVRVPHDVPHALIDPPMTVMTTERLAELLAEQPDFRHHPLIGVVDLRTSRACVI